MLDVFLELDKIEQEIKQLKFLLSKNRLYYIDIIEASYNNISLFDYEEWCLDYMSFSSYNELVANELKNIFNKFKKENMNYVDRLTFLLILKTMYESTILNLTRLNSDEFLTLLDLFNLKTNFMVASSHNMFQNNYIDIYIFVEGAFKINPLLIEILNYDIVDFIKFYINVKYNFKNDFYTLEEIYNLYQKINAETSLKLV